jgi:hypothetical protein
MSVWTPDRLEESLEKSSKFSISFSLLDGRVRADQKFGRLLDSSFSALRLLDMTPSEAHAQIKQSTIQSLLFSSTEEMARAEVAHLSS